MFGALGKGPRGTPLVLSLVIMVAVLLGPAAAASPRAESVGRGGGNALR